MIIINLQTFDKTFINYILVKRKNNFII